MKRFVLTYHNSSDSLEQVGSMTADQRLEAMKPWLAWKAKYNENILDFGSPLTGGQRVLADGTTSASQAEITGYSIIEAENRVKAIAILEDHPHHQSGPKAQIQLHECMAM